MFTYNSFIYIWFNSKTRMFYLGKHLGRIDDGYICSSKHMNIEYRHNPQYFNRRILEYVQDSTGNEILAAELRWLSMVKDEELGNKYYNRKNKNFGNTRGCTKSYVWNQGLTKAECDEYKLIRKNKLFCLLSEKPTRGVIYKPLISYSCEWCTQKFECNKTRKFCSKSCSANYGASLSKGIPHKNKGKEPWNKGMLGFKLSGPKRKIPQLTATVTGRKMATREDGIRYWIYPNKT